jgi:C4-dicarboxylate transporter DctM subunit
MVEDKYDKDYSGAVTVTSSCLSTVIPPSIQIVLAAAGCNVSVSKSLAAGLLPGLLVTIFLMFPNWYICKKRGYGTKHPFSWGKVFKSLSETWTALLAPLIILGSIFSGFVTPTEGAGVAVLYVLIIDGLIFRNLNLRDVWDCCKKTAALSGSILLIATASSVMNWVIAIEGIPQLLIKFLTGVPGGKVGFTIMIILIMVFIGMVMDATPATLIFAPLFMPAAQAMGIDQIHFIMLFVMGVAVGMTTPPYGVCLFSITTIANIPMVRLIRECVPFYVMLLIVFAMVAFIPPLSLWVPSLLGM